ncbi:hypothetical protein [Microbacterium dextranolyticum]|uniref:WxL domain-containing protein n=1 Tax=Microbacterium dextranolyticum TaxID=36806 RepID=A0A9W6M777_9MICO|nr:hypothetical protein [Microbacterium dextranolyticum]MBM7464054.1 hypothetical protein [Microbacterium dextranolyticum]GLJ96616.1 hypothetical protein GCM10017591_26790 [Microbacterium dextranolyticum]
MKNRATWTRVAAGVVGGAMLVGCAGAAMAAEVQNDDVNVNVNIEAKGALTMSVAATSTTLTEVASADTTLRQFDGKLPVVTVTDDRQQVPDGVFWYVTGQSSEFSAPGVTQKIAAGNLGWTPKLLSDNSDGAVSEGDEVVTTLDDPTSGSTSTPNNVGLVGDELFVLSLDSQQVRPTGEWKADADLFLKTPATVAPGAYSGKITLTLWEDAQQ